ncbi:PDZ domain-containing protein [Streptomyces fuscichromogenes]|uniref:PDZ domain-containing protein n=1 Tax=Streptomyces fuscichromogenes TaxID=1324013 RepID=A0A917XAG7_9ACTN|nr:PDZ domain-containing protein [Streptomyces fuscichromogenes]GGN01722.1 PDZ domain-containing protein [Streptomyces fuscichromogenes]
MEQTALRPKPIPGQERGDDPPADPARRPHAARRRGRRIRTLLLGSLVGAVLVLSGVGLGTVGATVIGMSRLAELRRQSPPTAPSPAPPAAPAPAPTAAATLGVEAVDAEKVGALVVGVHVPGPGYTAGLVRGDVLLQLGADRIDSAADLVRVIARAHPGKAARLTVRHASGGYQQLTVVPGVVI